MERRDYLPNTEREASTRPTRLIQEVLGNKRNLDQLINSETDSHIHVATQKAIDNFDRNESTFILNRLLSGIARDSDATRIKGAVFLFSAIDLRKVDEAKISDAYFTAVETQKREGDNQKNIDSLLEVGEIIIQHIPIKNKMKQTWDTFANRTNDFELEQYIKRRVNKIQLSPRGNKKWPHR